MTKFVAFASGKGGAGKTTLTLNTGFALSRLGKKVVLLDANLATPNLGPSLGLIDPAASLNNFLKKEKSLDEITYFQEENISLIPASPSYFEYQNTDSQTLDEVFEHLDNNAEFVLVDTPGGFGPELNNILKNTDETLIVVNPNLNSVMEALKTINLARSNNNIISGIILNMSNKGKNELKPKEIEEILEHPIISNIKTQNKIKKAAYRQAHIHELYPRSKLAKKFKNIAQHLSLEKIYH